MAKILTKPYRTFTPFTGDLPDPLHDYEQSITYHYNDLAAEFDNTSEVVTEIVSNGLNNIPDLPPIGTPIEADELYIHDGQVYRVRQTHNVTIYNPGDIPALFTVYRIETTDMGWVAGEKVDVGALRIYDGIKYECIQSHQTQTDWIPPAVPALWKVYQEPSGGSEWAVGVAYTIGDLVTYNGNKYSCRQNHTSQAGWTPTAVPALWLLQ